MDDAGVLYVLRWRFSFDMIESPSPYAMNYAGLEWAVFGHDLGQDGEQCRQAG
jgi:hypothetical protein